MHLPVDVWLFLPYDFLIEVLRMTMSVFKFWTSIPIILSEKSSSVRRGGIQCRIVQSCSGDIAIQESNWKRRWLCEDHSRISLVDCYGFDGMGYRNVDEWSKAFDKMTSLKQSGCGGLRHHIWDDDKMLSDKANRLFKKYINEVDLG